MVYSTQRAYKVLYAIQSVNVGVSGGDKKQLYYAQMQPSGYETTCSEQPFDDDIANFDHSDINSLHDSLFYLLEQER